MFNPSSPFPSLPPFIFTLPLPTGSLLKYFVSSDPVRQEQRERSQLSAMKDQCVKQWNRLLGGGSSRKGGGKKGNNVSSSSSSSSKRGGSGGFFSYNASKTVPTYKRVPGTQFIVDAFNCNPGRASGFFLSHFHSDHYGGLSKDFCKGSIYCTASTAALVKANIGVSDKYLTVLPMDRPVLVDGVKVTLVDANHCPGAVIFVFEMRSGAVYIHCGDCRYHPSMQDNPTLARLAGNGAIDTLYLDTTYCDPKYVFPPQDESIHYVVQTVQEELESTCVSCFLFYCSY